MTPTQTDVHGDGLCFIARTWATHNTTETGLDNGWRLAVGGPEGMSLTRNKLGVLKDSPGVRVTTGGNKELLMLLAVCVQAAFVTPFVH